MRNDVSKNSSITGIRCCVNAYTEPLLSTEWRETISPLPCNDGRDIHTDAQTDERDL
jgi:hypothetical protein